MDQSEIERYVREIVGMVWDGFRTNRAWPPKKPIMLALRRSGVDMDEVIGRSGHRLRIYRSGDEGVFASFSTLAQLDEARVLLAPLPVGR